MVASLTYDVDAVRKQFAYLRTGDASAVAYLDTAASAQKPDAVVDALAAFYRTSYANVHRGSYALSVRATEAYEGARRRVAHAIGASSPSEIVFTSGTTASINLVAATWGASLTAGDEVIVSEIEHHSNIVPWQLACERTGARLVPTPVQDDGAFDMDAFERRLSNRTKMVAVTHASNVLGTVFPVADIAQRARRVGAKVLVDGAQAAAHQRIDVHDIGCDFYAFSGHKAYGPTGTGVLWGCEESLSALPPFLGGGEMIETVSFERSTWAEPPARFEAGTPNIAGAVGLAAAMDWLAGVHDAGFGAWKAELLARGMDGLSAIDGLRLIGTAPSKASVMAFVIDGTHPHDVATLLDEQGVAVRAGHHCAEPAHARFGVSGSVRASIGAYTNMADVDRLCEAVARARRLLA